MNAAAGAGWGGVMDCCGKGVLTGAELPVNTGIVGPVVTTSSMIEGGEISRGDPGMGVSTDRNDGPEALACSKALEKLCIVAKRLCGSFASAIIITSSSCGGIPGIFSRKGLGEAITC